MADVEAALNERFAPHDSTLSSDLMLELVRIINLFSFDPEDLFYKWESYVQKMGVDTTVLDLQTTREFKRHLQDELQRESKPASHTSASAPRKTATAHQVSGRGEAVDVSHMLDGMLPETPGAKAAGVAKRKADRVDMPASAPGSKSSKNRMGGSPGENKISTAAAPAVSFESRANAGQVVEEFNAHLPAASAPVVAPTESRVKLKANTELPKFAYKGMAMKLTEASEILDDRIDTFTDLVQAFHDLPDGAFGNPAAQSTADVVAVGRIACDQPNGKLNLSSVVLETSRRMGAGLRVPLKFDASSCHLFPGKIVAVRGTNVSGEYFAVNEVLALPLPPIAASTPVEIESVNTRLSSADGETRPLSMMVGSGPYTTENDLSFAPLQTLLARAEDQHTDVLVLTGPFLDLEHPLIASGDIESYLPPDAKIQPDRATTNDIFRLLISPALSRLAHAVPTITIILVPSLRDAISKHVSWPQDRLPRQALGLPKQVQIVTNPITLSINEMVVGISTHDILSELRRESVSQSEAGQSAFQDDLLARLAGAIIEQQHFFPLFPPRAREAVTKPAGEESLPWGEERLAVGASLDLGYLKLGEWLNVRPDILILPSVLNPFTKVVDSVLCINPGSLSKKRGAGTFAAMSVQPLTVNDADREAEDAVAHRVFERARVDVTRI